MVHMARGIEFSLHSVCMLLHAAHCLSLLHLTEWVNERKSLLPGGPGFRVNPEPKVVAVMHHAALSLQEALAASGVNA